MSDPAKCISESRIRTLFNKGYYLKRFKEGKFREKKTHDKVPKNLPGSEPPNTRSRVINCYNEDDNRVVDHGDEE